MHVHKGLSIAMKIANKLVVASEFTAVTLMYYSIDNYFYNVAVAIG